MRTKGFTGIALALGLGLGANARAGISAREELIQNVTEAAKAWLNALDEDEDKMDKGRACVAAAEAAVKGGVEESTEIFRGGMELPKGLEAEDIPGARFVAEEGAPDGVWREGVYGVWHYPLSSVRDGLCKKVMALVAANRASSGASRAAVWIGEFAHPEESGKLDNLHMMNFAGEEARKCSASVAEAIAAGAAKDRLIEFYHHEARFEREKRDGGSTWIPLGELDAKVCKPAFDNADKTVKKILAEEAAKYAPFLKALSGDKLKIFKERKLLMYLVRGPGGRELTTPEDFRDAAAWYTSGLDTTGVWPTWSVDGWRFKGMKLASKYSKSGVGSSYPSGVFP